MREHPALNSLVSRMLRQVIRTGRLAEGATQVWRLFGNVPVEICGQQLLLHARGDDWWAQRLFYGHETEVDELRLWSKLCRACTGVLDVGAHTGIYSILTKKISPRCGVWSFDPDPANFARLEINLRLNGCEDVRRFALAISDRAGSIEFTTRKDGHLSLASSTDAQFTRAHVAELLTQTTVPTQTLDALLEKDEVGQVQLAKIDVEGAELAVLKGAQKLLAAFRPAILCESHCWEYLAAVLPGLDVASRREQQEQMQTMLGDLGYRFYTITQHGLVEVDEIGKIPQCPNYLLTAQQCGGVVSLADAEQVLPR